MKGNEEKTLQVAIPYRKRPAEVEMLVNLSGADSIGSIEANMGPLPVYQGKLLFGTAEVCVASDVAISVFEISSLLGILFDVTGTDSSGELDPLVVALQEISDSHPRHPVYVAPGFKLRQARSKWWRLALRYLLKGLDKYFSHRSRLMADPNRGDPWSTNLI